MSTAVPENLRYKETQRAWRTGLDGGLEGWFAKSHEPKFLGNAGVGLREETGGFANRSISVLMLLMLNIPQPAAARGLRMPQHSPAQSPAQHLSAPWHRTAPAPGCPAWQQLRNARGEHRMRPRVRRSRGEPGEEGSHSTCSPSCRSGVLTCQQRRLLLCRRD